MVLISLDVLALSLRELEPSDAKASHSVYDDSKTTEHLSFMPRTAEQCKAIIDSAVKGAEIEPRMVYLLAVFHEGSSSVLPGPQRVSAFIPRRSVLSFVVTRGGGLGRNSSSACAARVAQRGGSVARSE